MRSATYYRLHLPLTEAARQRAAPQPRAGQRQHALSRAVGRRARHRRNARAARGGGPGDGAAPASARRGPVRDGDRIQAVEACDLEHGRARRVCRRRCSSTPPRSATCSSWPVSSTCSVRESQADTGELHALPAGRPVRSAVADLVPGGRLPARARTTRSTGRPTTSACATLQLPCWPGPQFSWTLSDFVTHEPRERPAVRRSDRRRIALRPVARAAHRVASAFRARSLSQRHHARPTGRRWTTGSGRSSACSPEDAGAGAGAGARSSRLAFFYWMQTEAPRHDGGHRLPGSAPARRRARHRRRAGQAGVLPRGTAHPRRIHRAGAAHRRRGAAGRIAGRALRRQRRHRRLPDRPASEHARPQHRRHRLATRSRSRWARCCRCASTTCCRPARTSAPRASPTAPTASTPRSGASARRPARWPRSRWGAACRRARCAPTPGCWPISSAVLEAQGVLLQWPVFGALTPVLRTGYRPQQ